MQLLSSSDEDVDNNKRAVANKKQPPLSYRERMDAVEKTRVQMIQKVSCSSLIRRKATS